MSFELQDIQANSAIRILPIEQLTDYDRRLILSLYAPIIGTHAIALYLFCCDQYSQLTTIPMTHQMLLQRLNCGVQDFYIARKRLEGIGLWESYRQQNNDQIDYIYQLKAPLDAQTFLGDPILSGLLVDMISPNEYELLVNQFIKSSLDLSDYTNVTQSFYQVYGKQLGIHHQNTDNIMPKGSQKPDFTASKAFDWKFLTDLLQQTYLSDAILTQEVRNHIEIISQMYAIDALEMRDLLLKSHDIQHNQINIQQLYQMVRQSNVALAKLNVQVESTQRVEDEEVSNELDAFIKLCNELKTTEFIKLIKASKNQTTGTNQQFVVEAFELKLLERFVMTQKIPMSVVNVLIHHMLVEQNMATLSENYAVKTINDWIQNNVTNALEAVNYMKSRAQEVKEKQKQSTSYKQNTKRITLTQREKDALEDTDTLLSDSEREELLKGL